jgi:hypothetical protein
MAVVTGLLLIERTEVLMANIELLSRVGIEEIEQINSATVFYELTKDLVLPDSPNIKKEVIDSYFKEWNGHELPDLIDVIYRIYEHNYRIIEEIATFDYESGHMLGKFSKNGDNISLIKCERLWDEEWEYEMRHLLPPKVFEILFEANLPFILSDDGADIRSPDEYYYEYLDILHEDLRVVVNDSQRTLLKGWHSAVFGKSEISAKMKVG